VSCENVQGARRGRARFGDTALSTCGGGDDEKKGVTMPWSLLPRYGVHPAESSGLHVRQRSKKRVDLS
jgi:hypothetical protein